MSAEKTTPTQQQQPEGWINGNETKDLFALLMDHHLRHVATGEAGTEVFLGATRGYRVTLEIFNK
jgi:hypothetical protein